VTTVIKSGIFFCRACLKEKPIKEQSYDSRWCKPCCDFLENERRLSFPNRVERWMPKAQPLKERARKDKSLGATISRLEKKANRGKKGVTAINTTYHQTNPPRVTKPVTSITMGKATNTNMLQPNKALEREVIFKNIIKLSNEGKTTRDIARLVGLSHMTIARIIKGQRVLI